MTTRHNTNNNQTDETIVAGSQRRVIQLPLEIRRLIIRCVVDEGISVIEAAKIVGHGERSVRRIIKKFRKYKIPTACKRV
jgi:hypothetical protein